MLPGQLIDRLAKGITPRVVSSALGWGPQLIKDRLRRSHGQSILIKSATAIDGLRVQRVMTLHPCPGSPEGAKGKPAAEILTEGGHIGGDPHEHLRAPRGQPRCHHFIENERAAGGATGLANTSKIGCRGNAL